MPTPIETIADALIAFILSLLRDPDAAAAFADDPDAALAACGLDGIDPAAVRAVAPVVIDNANVRPRTADDPTPDGDDPDGDDPDGDDPTPHSGDPTVREIVNILNQFTTIDNRATIVDQSTNQNIWLEGGDLTQLFDQDAIIAAGDRSIAAGANVGIDGSSTDIDVGDVSIGNTAGSHNQTSTGVPASPSAEATSATDAEASLVADDDAAAAVDDVTAAVAQVADAATDAAEQASAPPAPPSEPEPLAADLTADDDFGADEPLTAPEPEPYPEEPIEEN